MTPVDVVIPTHTSRYLDLVLAGLARQTTRPRAIVVSCDTDDPAIGAVIERCAGDFGIEAWWVRRAHMGGERLCQVRNNAVRFLHDELGHTSGRVLILDGDMLAPDDLVAGHGARDTRPLTYAYRVNVNRAESERLDAQAVFEGRDRPALTDADRATLARRQRRYEKQRLLRRLRLGPAHKPKLLGGHFSVDLAVYLQLNGFDELYQGWGFKDDEFAYRAARLGHGVTIAVRDLPAWHLWHETRQADVPMRELPTARRFATRFRLPLVAEHGVRNPLPQESVLWTHYGGG